MQSGLIVSSVEDGSLADQADLEVGDVIESVGGLRVRSVEQLAEIVNPQLNQKPDRSVLVRVHQQAKHERFNQYRAAEQLAKQLCASLPAKENVELLAKDETWMMISPLCWLFIKRGLLK